MKITNNIQDNKYRFIASSYDVQKNIYNACLFIFHYKDRKHKPIVEVLFLFHHIELIFINVHPYFEAK